MKRSHAPSLLARIPFLHRPAYSIPVSSKSSQLTQGDYISLAAKVAVFLLICTNLVQVLLLFTQPKGPCQEDAQPIAPQAVSIEQEEGWYAPEQLMGPLSPVVLASIGASMPFQDRHFAVFIIYSWNFPLFWSSLQSYMAAGWGKRVVVLDNSANKRVLRDLLVNQMVGEVIPTRVQLTFSQCQNFIADISLEQNYTYFFWGHSDVALLASTPEKGFAEEVLECMDAIDEQQPDWGITFFEYDWFSATRQAVAREFRYDTFITVYMSDCDYYPRVRQKYGTVNAGSVCKATPRVYDMKEHMDLPLGDHAKTEDALKGIDINEGNRNTWKHKEWSLGEQIGWEIWELTTSQYFRYKWGLAEGKLSHSCKIEVEHKNGSTVLKQQPFETLDEVYTPVPFVSGHQSAE